MPNDTPAQLPLPATHSKVALAALLGTNNTSREFGLVLSKPDAEALLEKHQQTLRDTGRMEPGGSILPRLAYHFCDSPYISQHTWAETLYDLCESFYYFKNESRDTIDDEDLLCHMKHYFDTVCEGSVEYLNDTTLDILRRDAGLMPPPTTMGEIRTTEQEA